MAGKRIGRPPLFRKAMRNQIWTRLDDERTKAVLARARQDEVTLAVWLRRLVMRELGQSVTTP